MRMLAVDDHVRLTRDIPELQLNRGDVGVVCSTWFAPALAYEVEFCAGLESSTRALLRQDQLELSDEENAALAAAGAADIAG